MDQPATGILRITYLDGKNHKFEYVRETNTATLLSRLQDGIKQNILFIKLEKKLLAIPFYNIKSIEVSPPPSKLPNTTIVAVRQFEA
jgi:hypothetical protein